MVEMYCEVTIDITPSVSAAGRPMMAFAAPTTDGSRSAGT